MRMMKYQMALASLDRVDARAAFIPGDDWVVEEIGAVARTPGRSDRLFGVALGLAAGIACIAFMSGSFEATESTTSAVSMDGTRQSNPGSQAAAFVLGAPTAGDLITGPVEVRGHDVGLRRIRAAVLIDGVEIGAAEGNSAGTGSFETSIPVSVGPFPVDAELVLTSADDAGAILAHRELVLGPSDAAGILDLSAPRPGVVAVGGFVPSLSSDVAVRLLHADGSTIAEATALPSAAVGWAGALLPNPRFGAELPLIASPGTTILVEVEWKGAGGGSHSLRRLVVVPDGR